MNFDFERHGQQDSPCIGMCSTLFDEVCIGCGRTAEEVSHWVCLSPAQRKAVWARIMSEGQAIRFQRSNGVENDTGNNGH